MKCFYKNTYKFWKMKIDVFCFKREKISNEKKNTYLLFHNPKNMVNLFSSSKYLTSEEHFLTNHWIKFHNQLPNLVNFTSKMLYHLLGSYQPGLSKL